MRFGLTQPTALLQGWLGLLRRRFEQVQLLVDQNYHNIDPNTQARLKRTLFITTKHNMQIFGIGPIFI